MWDYDFANAIRQKNTNEYHRAFYKATYSGGKWNVLGGQLAFSGDAVKYCRAAGSVFADGDTAWCLLDVTSGKILIIDLVG
jgi:hypothetical protein